MAKAFGNTGVTSGLAADRLAMTGMVDGQLFFETDSYATYVYAGSGWMALEYGLYGDSAFMSNVSPGPNSSVSVIAEASGKYYIGGSFSFFGPSGVYGFVCLNSNGIVDSAFMSNVGVGPNGNVAAIVVQSDGKIIVAGGFTSWNNNASYARIVRLNTNGTVDTAFAANVSSGAVPNSNINTLCLQPNGQILVGGSFSTWNNVANGRIVRLNTDGTRDTAFSTNVGTGANSTVTRIVLDSSNNVFVGGSFSTWNSVASVFYLVKLNSSGVRDTTFSTNVGTAFGTTTTSMLVRSDGKLWVIGGNTFWNGVANNRYIIRLNNDGTKDTSYDNSVAFNNSLNNLFFLNDDRIVAVGNFSTYRLNTAVYNVILDSNGGFIRSFTNRVNSSVSTVLHASDGDVLLGGNWASWNYNFSYPYFVKVKV